MNKFKRVICKKKKTTLISILICLFAFTINLINEQVTVHTSSTYFYYVKSLPDFNKVMFALREYFVEIIS